MKQVAVLVVLLIAGFVSTVIAQGPGQAPKPDPEFQKLEMLVGRWTYDGEYKPGPLGAGGKITGEYTAKFILNGFALEAHTTEKGAMGETRYLEIDSYDAAKQKIAFHVYTDNGSGNSGTISVNGNTVTWEGKLVAAGQEYRFRVPIVFAADRRSATTKAEISSDGKSWAPFFEFKYRKSKTAPKT